MQFTLAAIALGAAVIGLVCSNLSARSTREPRSVADWRLCWSLFTWAAILGVVLFLATLPTRPPFAPGLSLGWGFLIGLVLGLYAAVEAGRSFAAGQWLMRSAGLIGAAVAGPALILLIFAEHAADALVGCALGAVLVAAIWRSGFAPMACREEDGSAVRFSGYRGVELFALLTAALVVGTRLALERYAPATGSIAGAYWALPALLGALITLVMVVVAGVGTSAADAERYRRPLALALAVSIVLIIGGALIGARLLGDGLPGVVLIAGVVGFALISCLAVTAPADDGEGMTAGPLGHALIIALVALAVVAVSFKVLHGFGESLALVGGIAFVALLVSGERRQSQSLAAALVTGGFVIVLLLAMYRLFLEKNAVSVTLDFQQHYTYFGLLLGAAGSFALLAYAQRSCRLARDEFDQFTALGVLVQRTAMLGPIVAAAPLLVLVIWGINALGGFLVGLIAAEMIWLMLLGLTSGRQGHVTLIAAPHLYLLAAFLVAIQFAPVVLPLANGPRLYRGIALGVVILIAVIWAAVSLLKAPERPEGGEGVE